MTDTVVVVFNVPLATLSDTACAETADFLSLVACEILKGEHRMTTQIVFSPEGAS